MELHPTLSCLLLFFGLRSISTEVLKGDNCTDYQVQFERGFSVPGDTVMLNSTLLSLSVFDFPTVPYNISWYDSTRGREVTNKTGRILVRGETLWFHNVTLDDDGEYVTVVRTPTRCYRQATKLVVDQPTDECGRPKKISRDLSLSVTDTIPCALTNYINKLDSYNITSSISWYKGCELIVDRAGRFTYMGKSKLKITNVETEDKGNYTCTLNFTLGGVTGSVSETSDVSISEEYFLAPQVREPINETIKAVIGSSFTKVCRVFVPCVGKPRVFVLWNVGKEFILTNKSSDRIYTADQSFGTPTVSSKGMWLKRPLIFSELREEDFYIKYSCHVFSSRGYARAYFTLQPEDPNILPPIGAVMGGTTFLFIISAIIYYIFKVDIVLWFRIAFPVFYTNKDLDGKLYDAYVAYPPPFAAGYSEEVETFAAHTLPQVLEKACGYKLFIVCRDCLAGQAMVDSVGENMEASRRLLLLYNASTFTKKRHTSSTSSNNNNNISKNSNSSDYGDNGESKTGDSSMGMSFESSEEVYSDPRQHFEIMTAMHSALMEGSIKVVLVELEEISPDQWALFPESVRHLRKKQGAVCWWKNQKRSQRGWRCLRGWVDGEQGEQEKQLSPSLSPSLRFWKEIRYHMPVRGKRAVNAEKTALLQHCSNTQCQKPHITASNPSS